MEKQKILIVDDSELVLAMAKDALEEAGYEVFTSTNGIEANSYIFSKNKPDLIILDVMLPMLDGNKKAKLLREKEFSRQIPILLISSKSEDEYEQVRYAVQTLVSKSLDPKVAKQTRERLHHKYGKPAARPAGG